MALSVTAAALAIADGKSVEELAVLGSVFMQLGDTISTVGAQKALIEDINGKKCGNENGYMQCVIE